MKYVALVFLVMLTKLAGAQGYGYVLFSPTGDTICVRGSFGESEKKDTITTYFIVSKASRKDFKRLSIIKIHQRKNCGPHSGYCCADYREIHKDTIAKYNLRFVSELQVSNARISSGYKILSTKEKHDGDKTYFESEVNYYIKIDKKKVLEYKMTFVAQDKNQKPEEPQIKGIFQSPVRDSFYIEYITVSKTYNPESQHIQSVNSHERCIIRKK